MRKVGADERFIPIILLELACIVALVIGAHFILPIHLSHPARNILLMACLVVLIAIYSKKHSHQHQTYSEGVKLKNDEKRKRRPAYWEAWPKKKKRGLPPDQSDIR